MPLTIFRLEALKSYRGPGLVLLVALIHGLLYQTIIPPWQHYDEPGHFEYAWLFANQPGAPAYGSHDQAMRREMLGSMIEHRFFENLDFLPSLVAQGDPIWIGVPQTGDLPAYYWLAAMPLRLIRFSDITFQLKTARLVSLGLYLLVVLAAWGVARELVEEGDALRWLAPLGVALLPALADLMSAVNNDVGAIAVFSCFFWSGMRIIRRGFSWPAAAALIGSAVLSYFTKATAAVAVVLVVIPLIYAIRTPAYRRIAAAGLILGGVSAVALLFTWGDAANWTRQGPQMALTQARQPAPLGEAVFRLFREQGQEPAAIAQRISEQDLAGLRGQTVTIGAWMWASQATTAMLPVLVKDGNQVTQAVEISEKPTFHSFVSRVGYAVHSLDVMLMPFTVAKNPNVEVYYDGVVFVEGEFSDKTTPEFSDATAGSGHWEGTAFENLVRNASAEKSWPALRLPVEARLAARLPVNPHELVAMALDWQISGAYFRETVRALNNTFWAQFGWGNLTLSVIQPVHPYLILFGATIAGFFGSIPAFWRRRLPTGMLVFLLSVLAMVWGLSLLRGVDAYRSGGFFTQARYAFPAVIPTMFVLMLGWLEWLGWFERLLRLPTWSKYALIVCFFLALDLAALLSIRAQL